jgi:single-stranded-DNA-specific exonuclease
LTTLDPIEAEKIAARLEELNASRKGIVAGIVKSARKRVRERYAPTDRVVVLGDTAWKPALLGLAANSIMTDRGGVVCLWGRDVNGDLKGSCRSDGSIAQPDLFAAARDAFIECGGHNASGGFSVSHERAATLAEDLAYAADSLTSESAVSTASGDVATHDAIVTLRELSWPLLHDVSRLAPFGVGNPKPIFRISHVTILSIKSFGKEKNHVELTLAYDENDSSMRAFDFFRHPEDFSYTPIIGGQATVLATLERDTFRRPARLALRLVDVLPL